MCAPPPPKIMLFGGCDVGWGGGVCQRELHYKLKFNKLKFFFFHCLNQKLFSKVAPATWEWSNLFVRISTGITKGKNLVTKVERKCKQQFAFSDVNEAYCWKPFWIIICLYINYRNVEIIECISVIEMLILPEKAASALLNKISDCFTLQASYSFQSLTPILLWVKTFGKFITIFIALLKPKSEMSRSTPNSS